MLAMSFNIRSLLSIAMVVFKGKMYKAEFEAVMLIKARYFLHNTRRFSSANAEKIDTTLRVPYQ